jgi:hypothetical protein
LVGNSSVYESVVDVTGETYSYGNETLTLDSSTMYLKGPIEGGHITFSGTGIVHLSKAYEGMVSAADKGITLDFDQAG